MLNCRNFARKQHRHAFRNPLGDTMEAFALFRQAMRRRSSLQLALATNRHPTLTLPEAAIFATTPVHAFRPAQKANSRDP